MVISCNPKMYVIPQMIQERIDMPQLVLEFALLLLQLFELVILMIE